DGSLLTPPALYVHRVVTRLRDGDLLIEASENEPSEQHLYRVTTHPGAPVVDAKRITSGSGWYLGAGGGDTIVIGAWSFDHAGVVWSVYRDGAKVGELTNLAATWTRGTRRPTSIQTWTCPGSRCGAGRSAAGCPGSRCCAGPTCTTRPWSGRRSPTGSCTTPRTPSGTWACRPTAPTCTPTTA